MRETIIGQPAPDTGIPWLARASGGRSPRRVRPWRGVDRDHAPHTLTQRLVSGDVLSRVHEVHEVASTALGGIAAAGLVALLGVDVR
jgi:hypothetical protein